MHDDSPSLYHYDGRGDVEAQTTGKLGNLTDQAAFTEDGGHNPNPPPLSESPENLPAYGAQEWTASGAEVERFHSNTKEQDPTGWIEEGQRLRVPGLESFLTPDPSGVFGPDGLNFYAYCRQNPWTKFDPEGLATEDDYDEDISEKQAQVRSDEQSYFKQEQADLAAGKGQVTMSYHSELSLKNQKIVESVSKRLKGALDLVNVVALMVSALDSQGAVGDQPEGSDEREWAMS